MSARSSAVMSASLTVGRIITLSPIEPFRRRGREVLGIDRAVAERLCDDDAVREAMHVLEHPVGVLVREHPEHCCHVGEVERLVHRLSERTSAIRIVRAIDEDGRLRLEDLEPTGLVIAAKASPTVSSASGRSPPVRKASASATAVAALCA